MHTWPGFVRVWEQKAAQDDQKYKNYTEEI